MRHLYQHCVPVSVAVSVALTFILRGNRVLINVLTIKYEGKNLAFTSLLLEEYNEASAARESTADPTKCKSLKPRISEAEKPALP